LYQTIKMPSAENWQKKRGMRRPQQKRNKKKMRKKPKKKLIKKNDQVETEHHNYKTIIVLFKNLKKCFSLFTLLVSFWQS
jgi:hypothetical protein